VLVPSRPSAADLSGILKGKGKGMKALVSTESHGKMSLRKHQAEMINVIDGIIAGSAAKNIIVKAVPGSGKSSLPLIAGKLITAGLADAICWVCPRMTLQDQAERNFIDPFFRQMFNHRLTIRSSTNENNPSRGLNGFVTTYQALGVDKDQTALRDFRRKRYILILDECHHANAEEGAAWTEALKPLYELAAYRVLMTGTAMRGDAKPIAFINDDKAAAAIIDYTRRDALQDKAILPLKFVLFDGVSKWESSKGTEEEAKISTQTPEKGCYALYTALHTDYAKELLTASIAHWKSYRAKKSGHGKLLVVAADIKQAKEYTAYLKSMGEQAMIATSDDTPGAVKVIQDLKTGSLNIAVSVGMCYEGLDCPSISHIACLTNIRSLPWISQMVARAVRIDPNAGPYGSQMAYVFAPKDRLFVECQKQIETDQQWARLKEERDRQDGMGEGEGGEFCLTSPGGITPLSSRMTDKQEVILNSPQSIGEPFMMTSSEIEKSLLDQIESHIRQFSFQNRYNPKRINGEVFAAMGKARREMTTAELERCLSHIRSVYPLSHIRGTGRPRVPTKATPYAVGWRS
jgi:superfamily II DNA or RNA helicase